MKSIQILLFGSTDDSVIILNSIYQLSTINYQLKGVVTQPAKGVGRKQVLTLTPVEEWAREHGIPVFTFPTLREKPWVYEDEQAVINTLQPLSADLLVSASYGQMIPFPLIESTPLGGINVHPSLLPRWRGTDPIPWTIVSGDEETGTTIVTLSKTFDEGAIWAQKRIPVPPDAKTTDLRRHLFETGAGMLTEVLDQMQERAVKPDKTHLTLTDTEKTYARRLIREDGYIPFPLLEIAITDGKRLLIALEQSENLAMIKELRKQNAFGDVPIGLFLERMVRALNPWPGVWTQVETRNKEQETGNQVPEAKRLKILASHISADTGNLTVDLVQLEGKNPVSYEQFGKAYSMAR